MRDGMKRKRGKVRKQTMRDEEREYVIMNCTCAFIIKEKKQVSKDINDNTIKICGCTTYIHVTKLERIQSIYGARFKKTLHTKETLKTTSYYT